MIADSQGEATAIQGNYPHADLAAKEGHVTSGVEHIAGARVATSAIPVDAAGETHWVEVLSSSLGGGERRRRSGRAGRS